MNELTSMTNYIYRSQLASGLSVIRRWSSLPVLQPVEGGIADVLKELPRFGRQPFMMTSLYNVNVAANPFLDMVYRVPNRLDEDPVPVGVVSRNYRLVDHHQVLHTVEEVLEQCKVDMSKLNVVGQWTVHGERAHFSLILPSGGPFSLSLGEKDEMRFRIELLNSVDGSCRLTAATGWLRLVCSNGLIVSKMLTQLRRQHRQELNLMELRQILRQALQSAGEDHNIINKWRRQPVSDEALVRWVDEDVRKDWGIKAAVRVLAIARSGKDAEPRGDLKGKRPSQIDVNLTDEVPGIRAPVSDAFGISQVLAWVAGRRADLQEQLEWRSQVRTLVDQLSDRSR